MFRAGLQIWGSCGKSFNNVQQEGKRVTMVNHHGESTVHLKQVCRTCWCTLLVHQDCASRLCIKRVHQQCASTQRDSSHLYKYLIEEAIEATADLMLVIPPEILVPQTFYRHIRLCRPFTQRLDQILLVLRSSEKTRCQQTIAINHKVYWSSIKGSS